MKCQPHARFHVIRLSSLLYWLVTDIQKTVPEAHRLINKINWLNKSSKYTWKELWQAQQSDMVMSMKVSFSVKILWNFKKLYLHKFPRRFGEKRRETGLYWEATILLGTLDMIFDLIFIIILGSWDYNPHLIDKETNDRHTETKFELRWQIQCPAQYTALHPK